jgi:hypothetical protein
LVGNELKDRGVAELSICLNSAQTERTVNFHWAHEIEAGVAFCLREGHRNLVGSDFTPPPFRDQFRAILEDSKARYLDDGECIQFVAPSASTLADMLDRVNWVDTIPFRLADLAMESMDRPTLTKRWLMHAPLDWFEQNVGNVDMLCYLATAPYFGIDIKSAHIDTVQLLDLLRPVLQQYDLRIRKAELDCLHITGD